MNKGLIIFLVGAVILVSLSVFKVDQTEKALLLRLGEVKQAQFEPGLHFKLPIADTVVKFDARIQTLDSASERYLTSEKKNVLVDSFVKWRVNHEEQFYTSVRGDPATANDRLMAVVQKQLKDEFGKRTIQQVVSGERAEVMTVLANALQKQAGELGIEIVDTRIKRVDLPEEVSISVYNRMTAERKEVAQRFRSEGERQALEIRAEADRDSTIILANAERDAQEIRGEGDAEATRIYADAFSQDAEFYSLYRSLEAYKRSFNDPSDVLLLEPDTEFFKYFKQSEAAR
ncbi:MAG: protease modulator HflC [Gammaproteobacteria bacterium]|nr:protease modulator HflC [Gammaproteobacteria bacterium]